MGLTIPVLIVLAAFALFVGCYSSYKGGLLDEVLIVRNGPFGHSQVDTPQKAERSSAQGLWHSDHWEPTPGPPVP